MAASLRNVICPFWSTYLQKIHNVALVQQVNYSYKTKRRERQKKPILKFYDEHIAHLYNHGEIKKDRYVGVPTDAKDQKPHPETVFKGFYELDPPKGNIADKKPHPVLLKAGKKYKWCACGYSNHQPFCDGSHITVNEKNIMRPKHTLTYHRPLTFTVPEDGEYWMCQCKQTNDRPFCDGSHLAQEIQDKIKS